jgi:hypothetical protein
MRRILLSKSELAEELGVHATRVSQFVRRGMPVRSDGKCNLERCCRWVMDHLDGDNNTDGGSRARSHAGEWLYLLQRRRAREEASR